MLEAWLDQFNLSLKLNAETNGVTHSPNAMLSTGKINQSSVNNSWKNSISITLKSWPHSTRINQKTRTNTAESASTGAILNPNRGKQVAHLFNDAVCPAFGDSYA
jgi:hypothetical protein